MDRSLCLLLLAAVLQICGAYKILVVFPFPGRSHGILGEGYVRHLLEAGHEVTYITPYPLKNSNPKLHHIDVSDNIAGFECEYLNDGQKPVKCKFDLRTEGSVYICKHTTSHKISLKGIIDKEQVVDMRTIIPKMMSVSKSTITNLNVQALLNDPKQTFDVVIGEWMGNEIYSGFGTVFNCPYIWSSSVESHWMILRLIHESSNPAFNPAILSDAIPPFDFFQRAKSLFSQWFMLALKRFYIQPQEKAMYEELLRPIIAKQGREVPPYEEVLFNASMILSNSHVVMGQPISLPPNNKEIGGYHINTDIKPLPQDLQKIMDNAKHGVIYFSLGSNVNSKDFPEKIKKDILQMLGGLKQTVIWKFEEDLAEKPKNVHIVKWAPQPSILAHPNCRLFITHGGLLSTTETVYFGVPTIVMPTAGDQHVNAGRAVKKGFAIKVDLSYEMASEMKIAIEEVLNNPKFTEKVKELSMIYHDRVVPPGKELVHWVEHVARTRGAPHLRSPALMLPWYQKIYLDLAAVVLAILIVIKYVFKMVKNLLCKKKSNSQKKNN